MSTTTRRSFFGAITAMLAFVPAWAREDAEAVVVASNDDILWYQTLTHKDGTAGHFAVYSDQMVLIPPGWMRADLLPRLQVD